MPYVLIADGNVADYPFGLGGLRSAFPNVSFPASPSDELLADFGVFPVEETASPPVTDGQRLVEVAPELENGAWVQQWQVVDLSVDEVATKLTAAKAALWEQVKAKREQAMAAGCTVPGVGVVDTDAASMDNLTQGVAGAIMAAMASIPFTINWTLADNTVVTLDGAQMMAVGKLAGERKALCHVRSQVLRAAIEAAEDFAALGVIDITQGWPA